MLSCLVVRKSHYFSHDLHYYNTFLPSLEQTALLVLGLIKARLPKNEMCCDWLAGPVHCDWRTAAGVSLLSCTLPKQQVSQYCHINSDPENIEQEDHAEPLHALILQGILKW